MRLDANLSKSEAIEYQFPLRSHGMDLGNAAQFTTDIFAVVNDRENQKGARC